jgi:hypothetical protein
LEEHKEDEETQKPKWVLKFLLSKNWEQQLAKTIRIFTTYHHLMGTTEKLIKCEGRVKILSELFNNLQQQVEKKHGLSVLRSFTRSVTTLILLEELLKTSKSAMAKQGNSPVLFPIENTHQIVKQISLNSNFIRLLGELLKHVSQQNLMQG